MSTYLKEISNHAATNLNLKRNGYIDLSSDIIFPRRRLGQMVHL